MAKRPKSKTGTEIPAALASKLAARSERKEQQRAAQTPPYPTTVHNADTDKAAAKGALSAMPKWGYGPQIK